MGKPVFTTLFKAHRSERDFEASLGVAISPVPESKSTSSGGVLASGEEFLVTIPRERIPTPRAPPAGALGAP